MARVLTLGAMIAALLAAAGNVVLSGASGSPAVPTSTEVFGGADHQVSAGGALPPNAPPGAATTYQLNPRHDGLAPGSLPAPLERAWTLDLNAMVGYPLVVNGRVFVVTRRQSTSEAGTLLYGIDQQSGAVLWGPVDLPGNNSINGIAADGANVYSINQGGLLRAFDQTFGTEVWQIDLPFQHSFGSPPTVVDGTIFVGGAGSGGTLYAVSAADGSIVWTASVNGSHSSPAVAGDGVYVSYACDWTYRFDRFTGANVWTHTTGCTGGGWRAAVVHGDHVYVRDTFDAPPATILRASDGSQVGTFSSVFAPAFDGHRGYYTPAKPYFNGPALTAVDLQTGAVQWSHSGEAYSVAPLVMDGKVIIGTGHGQVLVYDAVTGALLWSDNAGAPIRYADEGLVSLLVGLAAVDGLLLVPASDTLVAYRPCSGLCAPPPPTPVPQAHMAFDADSQTAGIQSTRTVFGSSTFDTGIQIVSLSDPPYEFYQWLIEYPPGLLRVSPPVVEHTSATGLPLCADPYPTSPVMYPWDETLGGGCIRGSSADEGSRYVGLTTTIGMQCLTDGVATVYLLDRGHDPDFGTSLFRGIFIPTSTQGATITCQVSATSTPTPTNTSTPTLTPTPTITPTPSPTPSPLPAGSSAKGIIEPFDADPLENVWLCKSNAGASSIMCGTADVFELIRLPNDRDTCNDDDDDDGAGCTPVWNGIRWVSAASDWDGDFIDLDFDAPCATQTTPGCLPDAVSEIGEGLGAFEFQIKFDHKIFQHPIFDTSATVLDDTGRLAICIHDVVTENWVLFGCTSKGVPNGGAVDLCMVPNALAGSCATDTHEGPSVQDLSVMGRVTFQTQPDLLERLRPTKDNGVRADLLDENCEAADVFGSPLNMELEDNGSNEAPSGGLTANCTDVTLTVRMLEGDVDLDCDVDVVDDQQIAFRYGATFGVLTYDPVFDVEPNTTPTDFDIDIKDLQFVFGRNGSTCEAPIPPQEPQPAIPDP